MLKRPSSSASSSRRPNVAPSIRARDELLCRSGCGFFGNPEWQWYCSKCWREHKAAEGAAGTNPQSPAKAQQDKRKKDRRKGGSPQHEGATNRHFRTLFGKGDKSKAAKEGASSPAGPRARSPTPSTASTASAAAAEPSAEAKAVSSEFAGFLNARLSRPGVVDVSRQLKSFVDSLSQHAAGDGAIAEAAGLAQEFYQGFRRRLATEPVYQGLSEDDREAALDWAERYALVFCHKDLFCPAGTDDEEKDLQLQSRIRRLNWIGTKHLGCEINEASQEVRDILHQSITHILEMDGKPSPQEKLSTVVSCCKSIFDMLRESTGQPASADEFLPCLIYVLLKSNPPRMHSNINFISRFRNEEKLRMGEAGYFFANLCCALSFIEEMTAESIGMDPEEFAGFLSGRVVPPGSWQSSLLMCESLQAMQQDLKALADLRARHDRVLRGALDLKASMEAFRAEIHDEVEAVLARTAFEIRGPRRPAEVDGGSPPPPELPSPILPTAPGEAAPTAEPAEAAEAVGADEKEPEPKEEPKVNEEEAMEETEAPATPPRAAPSAAAGLPDYKGFTAQSFSIPSISCSNEKTERKSEE